MPRKMRNLLGLPILSFWLFLYGVAQAPSSDFDDLMILRALRDTFQNFTRVNHVQFGVLYLPPPEAEYGRPAFEPTPPLDDGVARVLFPPIDVELNPHEYPYNYAMVGVDEGGDVYGETILIPPSHRDVHSERILLTLVFPRMLLWYERRFGMSPSDLYLYSHYQPCQMCTRLIGDFYSGRPEVRIVVGFSEPYFRRSEAESARREDRLAESLHQHGGKMLQVTDAHNVRLGHYLTGAKDD